MSYKGWERGYDFEKGRQAYRTQQEFASENAGPIGVLLLLILLMCFVSMALDAAADAENRYIERKERARIESEVKEWVLKTNLINEVAPDEDCVKNGSIWFKAGHTKTTRYGLWDKAEDTWAVVEIYFVIDGQYQHGTNFILYRYNENDNWEIQWRSDRDKVLRDLNQVPNWEIQPYIEPKYITVTDEYSVKDICILDRYNVCVKLLNQGARYSYYEEERAILYTTDAGKNWELHLLGVPGLEQEFQRELGKKFYVYD